MRPEFTGIFFIRSRDWGGGVQESILILKMSSVSANCFWNYFLKDRDSLWGLLWVQTVCKGYQQTILADNINVYLHSMWWFIPAVCLVSTKAYFDSRCRHHFIIKFFNSVNLEQFLKLFRPRHSDHVSFYKNQDYLWTKHATVLLICTYVMSIKVQNKEIYSFNFYVLRNSMYYIIDWLIKQNSWRTDWVLVFSTYYQFFSANSSVKLKDFSRT